MTVAGTLQPMPSLAGVLRQVWPRHAAKMAAQAARTSVRTAEKWVGAFACPSADTLLRMAQENDELRAELVRLLTEAPGVEAVEGDHRAVAGATASSEGAAADEAGGLVAAVERGAVAP